MDDLAEPAIPLVVMPGEAQRLWRRGCRLEREPGIRPAAKHLEQDRIDLAALIYSGDRYARPRGPCLLGHSGEEAESRVYLAAVRRRNDHDVTLRLVQAGANVTITMLRCAWYRLVQTLISLLSWLLSVMFSPTGSPLPSSTLDCPAAFAMTQQ